MRRYLNTLLILVTLLGVWAWPMPAHGQEPPAESPERPLADIIDDLQGLITDLPLCHGGRSGSNLECEGQVVVSPPTNPAGASNSTQTDLPLVDYLPFTKIVPNGGPNGDTCSTTAYREVPHGFDPTSIPDWAFNDVRSGIYPECPTDPGTAADPQTPRSFAARYWQNVPLPEPAPYIAPGRAITGMFAYLETRGTTTHTYTEPNTPFGPLTIVAHGRYYVDWGDGTRTGPHSAEGGPWPDGKIKHEYIHIGSYDVVVTERWTATWGFGDQSGALDELRTVGRIDDFPVQQIQAVVLR